MYSSFTMHKYIYFCNFWVKTVFKIKKKNFWCHRNLLYNTVLYQMVLTGVARYFKKTFELSNDLNQKNIT